MNIVVFGATGTVGRRIVLEGLRRGNDITAVSRTIEAGDMQGVETVKGDVLDSTFVQQIAQGRDAVISAIGPREREDLSMLSRAAESLIDGMESNPTVRLIVVGGAGGLEVGNGMRLMDTEAFHDDWKPIAKAHFEALEVYQKAPHNVQWTYFHPAAMLEARERTGTYRRGTDHLLTDEHGQSYISAEDLAVAIFDELETATPTLGRVTVAY